MQRHPEDQQLHPVYFMNRKTTPAERRYSSYQLEFLAVVTALDKLRNYVLGLRFKVCDECRYDQKSALLISGGKYE